MKYTNLFKVALAAVVAAGVTMTSCKDDDEPFVKPKLSFDKDSYAVKESDQTLDVKIVLDKAYSEDIKVTFKLAGTAVDSVAGAASTTDRIYADYSIIGKQREITIPKDATEGVIRIRLYSDDRVEGTYNETTNKLAPETISISIDDVSSNDIEITRQDDTEISIEQEDGVSVVLDWGETYTDVDMDLILWLENQSNELVPVNYLSAQGSFNSPEVLFLPTKVFTSGSYGLSCVYYAGSPDPLNFQVYFTQIVNAGIGDEQSVEGQYTKANINKWDDETVGTDLQLAVTFTLNGSVASDINFTAPASGSRMGTGKVLKEIGRKGSQNSTFDFLRK